MTARDQQGHKGEFRRVFAQKWRQQMPFQVVNAQHRLIQCSGHGAGRPGAHQQSASQARATGEGHHIDVVELYPGFGQHFFRQRQHAANMVAAGQFWHHTAIGTVHFNLAVQRMAEQGGHALSIRHAHQGHAGFIAGGFDSEDQQTHGVQV